jgi:hypothetical protein
VSGSETRSLGVGALAGVGAWLEIKHLVEAAWLPFSKCPNALAVWHVLWTVEDATLLGLVVALVLLYVSIKALIIPPVLKLGSWLRLNLSKHAEERTSQPAPGQNNP